MMIEEIEAVANHWFVNQPLMPKQGDWQVLESMGVRRFEEVDTIFYKVQFPQGWKKILDPDDHRGSLLVNERGERKALIFYKRTPYDHAAYFYI